MAGRTGQAWGAERWGIDTLLLHGNQGADPATGAVVPPIHPASTFVREAINDDAQYRYSRGANPTRAALEAILNGLEHGAGASAFASGMAAVTAAIQLLSAGDHAVVGYDCYLSTYHLFANDLPRYGIEATFVDLPDLDAVRDAIKPNTRMIWIETPTNPLRDVVDLGAIAAMAREANALTVVDNTFASPYCQNPLDWGCDLVVHSTTKYLGGHSDLVGGAVISRTVGAGGADHRSAVLPRRGAQPVRLLVTHPGYPHPRRADAADHGERATDRGVAARRSACDPGNLPRPRRTPGTRTGAAADDRRLQRDGLVRDRWRDRGGAQSFFWDRTFRAGNKPGGGSNR